MHPRRDGTYPEKDETYPYQVTAITVTVLLSGLVSTLDGIVILSFSPQWNLKAFIK